MSALFAKLPPQLAVRCTTGLGKSHQARAMAAEWLRRERTRGGRRTAVILVPTHALAGEAVARFNVEHAPLRARQYRGIGQPDPGNDGHTMCRRLEVVAPLTRLGVSLRDLCARRRPKRCCPHRSSCGYKKQDSLRPGLDVDLWIGSHQLLFQKMPRCMGGGDAPPGLLIIDESFWRAALRGIDHPERLAVAALAQIGRGSINKPYQVLSRILARVAAAMPEDGPLPVRVFFNMVPTKGDRGQCPGGQLSDACRAAFEMLADHGARPDMTDGELRALAERMSATTALRQARLWRLLHDEFSGLSDREHAPTIERETLDLGTGEQAYLRLRWREAITHSWINVPTLILDATASPELIKPFFPIAPVEEVSAPMQNTKTVQVIDTLLSKAAILPSDTASDRKNAERARNLQRVRDLLAVIASRTSRAIEIDGHAQPIKVLAVAAKAVRGALEALGLPEGVVLRHYGAVAGLDAFGRVPALVCIGRLELPLEVAELHASVFSDGPVERLNSDRYPQREAPVETAHDILPGWRSYHPDPMAEAIRSQWCEAELLQAIGRARAVRRTPNTPLDLFVLSAVPLPITVDHPVRWRDVIPTAIEVDLAERGACCLSYGELVRVSGTICRNKEHARREVQAFTERYPQAASGGGVGVSDCLLVDSYRQSDTPKDTRCGSHYRLLPSLLVIEYQRPGRGAQWCRAVVRKGHGRASARAAVEALVGEVKGWRYGPAIRQPLPAAPPARVPIILHLEQDTARWIPTTDAAGDRPTCGVLGDGRVFYRRPMPGHARQDA